MKKTARKIFRYGAGLFLLTVIGGAVACWWNREPEKALPKPEACPVVSNVLGTIERTFGEPGDTLRLDVRRMSVAEFHARLRGVSAAAVLWTPGEGDWLLTGVKNGSSNTLERVMARLAEEETAYSLAELFANCVGTVAEIEPAFAALDPSEGVVPENFVTQFIPAFGWLADGEVDADIVKTARQEMRSMQVVRRVALEGNILSRDQKEQEAIAKWAGAYKRTKHDTLLMERMHHLAKNGEVFFRVGKYGMACKCFETLIQINPRDYVAAANCAECLKRLGRREYAAEIEKKAEELRAQAERGERKE